MRVVYVGQLWQGGTCRARADVLRERGWEVIPFDITAYQNAGGRVMRSLQHRLLTGPAVWRLNQDILSFVKGHGKVDVMWVDKGTWVHTSTLERVKDMSRAVLVHYTPDPAFTVHTSRHFRNGVQFYDFCITTKRYELDAYQRADAKRVVFTWQGIDDRFMQCPQCNEIEGSHRSGIVFIGHREKHYQRVLGEIARRDHDLNIWGQGWEKLSTQQTAPAHCVKGGPVWDKEYVRALASARIGIGLLSKYCPDQFTTRSFEVPAAGTLLIAERTAEHQALFEEGKEAEFFSSPEELNDKIAFYLRNEAARVEIARRGRQKVLACYKWSDVLSPALHMLTGLTRIRIPK